MTRGTMRTVLRRHLNETSPDQWQDTDLNDLLNAGLQQVQKEITKINPDAVVYLATIDLVAGRDLYDLPQGPGFLHEKEVGILSSGAYTPIDYKDWSFARQLASGTAQVYTRVGRWIGIYPVPTSSVSAGIRVLFVPALEMAADSTVPDIVLPLHMAIVYWAHLFAIGETSEPAKEIKDVLAEIINDIPKWYFVSGAKPEQFNPTIDKGY